MATVSLHIANWLSLAQNGAGYFGNQQCERWGFRSSGHGDNAANSELPQSLVVGAQGESRAVWRSRGGLIQRDQPALDGQTGSAATDISDEPRCSNRRAHAVARIRVTDLWMVCRLHILRNVHLYAPYALLLAVLGLHSTRVPYGVRTWHCYQRHVCENALHTQSSQVGHIRIRGSKFEPEGICGPLLSLVSLLGMPKQCERLVGLWVVVHCCRSMGKGAKICLQCSVQGGGGGEFLF